MLLFAIGQRQPAPRRLVTICLGHTKKPRLMGITRRGSVGEVKERNAHRETCAVPSSTPSTRSDNGSLVLSHLPSSNRFHGT